MQQPLFNYRRRKVGGILVRAAGAAPVLFLLVPFVQPTGGLMQINMDTGEAYAASKAIAAGEELELVTIGPSHYDVVCWYTADDEVRWVKSCSTLKAAVDEYNRWVTNKEVVPNFN
jgi:hypothetical protein